MEWGTRKSMRGAQVLLPDTPGLAVGFEEEGTRKRARAAGGRGNQAASYLCVNANGSVLASDLLVVVIVVQRAMTSNLLCAYVFAHALLVPSVCSLEMSDVPTPYTKPKVQGRALGAEQEEKAGGWNLHHTEFVVEEDREEGVEEKAEEEMEVAEDKMEAKEKADEPENRGVESIGAVTTGTGSPLVTIECSKPTGLLKGTTTNQAAISPSPLTTAMTAPYN
jgi:hypothetical protein